MMDPRRQFTGPPRVPRSPWPSVVLIFGLALICGLTATIIAMITR